jgi:hypothetical protein
MTLCSASRLSIETLSGATSQPSVWARDAHSMAVPVARTAKSARKDDAGVAVEAICACAINTSIVIAEVHSGSG